MGLARCGGQAIRELRFPAGDAYDTNQAAVVAVECIETFSPGVLDGEAVGEGEVGGLESVDGGQHGLLVVKPESSELE